MEYLKHSCLCFSFVFVLLHNVHVVEVVSASCEHALGMANGKIRDEQLSASSRLNDVAQARLTPTNSGAWRSEGRDQNRWFQVNFDAPIYVTTIATQGLVRLDEGYILSYRVNTSLHDLNIQPQVWTNVRNNQGQLDFSGNTNGEDIVTQTVKAPVILRSIRILLRSCVDRCYLRFELYGCQVLPTTATSSLPTTSKASVRTDLKEIKPTSTAQMQTDEESSNSHSTATIEQSMEPKFVNTESSNSHSTATIEQSMEPKFVNTESSISHSTATIKQSMEPEFVNTDITKMVTIGASVGGVVLLGLVLLTVSVCFVQRSKRNAATEAKLSDIQLESTSNNAHLNMTESTNPLQNEDQAVRTPNDHISDDDTTYLQPKVTTNPSDKYGEYEYVSNVNLAKETPYKCRVVMRKDPDGQLYTDVDDSPKQPDSVYQEVTNPENLKQADMYLALDPTSQVAICTYQPLNMYESVEEEIKHTYLSVNASMMNKSGSHSPKGSATTNDVDRGQAEEATTSRPIYGNSAVVKQRQKRH